METLTDHHRPPAASAEDNRPTAAEISQSATRAAITAAVNAAYTLGRIDGQLAARGQDAGLEAERDRLAGQVAALGTMAGAS